MVRNKKRVIPGFRFSLSITFGMLAVFIVIPLLSVLTQAFRIAPQRFWEIVTDKTVSAAFWTSISLSVLAAFINAVFGTILAWVLVRYSFPGKRLMDGLIELPFAMPTAVCGITLSGLYATTGMLGAPLARLGIYVSYTKLGILVALVFIGIPFTVRSVMPVLAGLDDACEEAAFTLGAGNFMTFRRVVLPELFPAILTGFALSCARGIGEYGSVIYISGNSAREHTQVISYIIMQKLSYMDYESATAIALVMLLISFLILLGINAVLVWQSRRTSGEMQMQTGGRKTAQRALGGGRILIIISGVFVLFMLIIPLFSVLWNALRKGVPFFLKSISAEYVISAAGVTLLAVVSALLVNTFFGLMAAWLFGCFDFRGKQVLAALIDIPFSISPVIAGLSYIMMFGRLGWAYPFLQWLNASFGWNVQIVFALPGVVLATIFVTFPFVSRELIPVINAAGRDEEEAAAMMGAGGLTVFRRITFPHIKWALVYGMILCMARALGEFGAVSALSKTRGKTFTLPLEIDALYMSGNADSITAAYSVSLLLVAAAVIVLILRSILEEKERRGNPNVCGT